MIFWPAVADTYDNHLFHIMIQNNLIYLAMTTNDFERRIAFAFLEKIRLYPKANGALKHRLLTHYL